MTDTAPVARPIAAARLIRIQAISLTNFRAFPGPSAARFELHGKNLLVYGENGAGKSSLFHALTGFFSFRPTGALADQKNVFYSQPDAECKVSVEYVGDAKPVDWTTTEHPCVADLDLPVTDFYEFFSPIAIRGRSMRRGAAPFWTTKRYSTQTSVMEKMKSTCLKLRSNICCVTIR